MNFSFFFHIRQTPLSKKSTKPIISVILTPSHYCYLHKIIISVTPLPPWYALSPLTFLSPQPIFYCININGVIPFQFSMMDWFQAIWTNDVMVYSRKDAALSIFINRTEIMNGKLIHFNVFQQNIEEESKWHKFYKHVKIIQNNY